LTLVALFAMTAGAWAAITTEDIGKVICTDGSLYATKILAQNDGKTAAAMIGYVDTENNKALAIALTDGNNNMDWTQACEYCTGLNTSLPVPNGTWVLPTEEQWNSVLTLEEVVPGYEAYKSESLNTKLNAAKGNALDNNGMYYWSATETSGGSYVNCISFNYGMASFSTGRKAATEGSMTRAFLEIELSGIEVTWDATTKQATFEMPGYDVVLTPIYAPTAQWATEGNDVLAPTAAEGVIAGTDAPLIVEGTVATGQGTVMYFATTEQLTAEQAAQANGWLSTLPTAAGYDDATTVYVWYYIQGADTPDGQTATAENTFNDSEICATPLEVSVLSNKFDITFNAANANTIEGQNGKGTVTVKTGDAEAVDKTADIDENHQLKAVKMGSTVTINAKEGYKFRKVEAKKAEAPATPEGPTLAQTLTTANMTVKVYYTYNDMNNTCEFLSNGDGTYTFQSGTGYVGGDNGKAKALVVENGKLVFKQNFYATIGQLWDKVGISITFDTSENTYSIWQGSNETLNPSLSKVEVNGTQIAVTKQ
jgi:hypothetical protein